MNFTIPSITINIPTTTITNTITKLKALRPTKLPTLPLHQSMQLVNIQLEDCILNKHSHHVNQARYYHLSKTNDISHLLKLHY